MQLQALKRSEQQKQAQNSAQKPQNPQPVKKVQPPVQIPQKP